MPFYIPCTTFYVGAFMKSALVTRFLLAITITYLLSKATVSMVLDKTIYLITGVLRSQTITIQFRSHITTLSSIVHNKLPDPA